jgi:acyl-CoA dehydrogenase
VKFTITPRIEDFRARIARFVADEILPAEARPEASDAHGNIALGWLEGLREKARSEGL